uniref:Uncharacterized protein n=1 Tax=Anopheles maculatus TaxID=74869 RepID=A0A182SZG3_9DIPT
MLPNPPNFVMRRSKELSVSVARQRHEGCGGNRVSRVFGLPKASLTFWLCQSLIRAWLEINDAPFIGLTMNRIAMWLLTFASVVVVFHKASLANGTFILVELSTRSKA